MLYGMLSLIASMASLARTVWKVGVTGGIGSGKSNVCSVLRSLGAVTIDADVLGA